MKSLLILSLLFIGSSSFGQSSDTGDVEKDINSNILRTTKKKKVERVEVTGSRIRRSDFEGPSPVKIIDRKSLEESPYNSVSDYLRELTINSFGSSREGSGRVTAGNAGISLRGLGASNTLVLLNGNRMAPDGVTGAVDLNLIPEVAIESTEILKDGASAIYGSDALGGVVSFKTRKDFTGSEVSLRTSVAENEGGDRIDVSAITGIQRKNSSVTAAVQYRQNSEIYDRDRAWSRPDIIRNSDNTTTYANYSATAPVAGYIDQNGSWALVDGSCEAANAEHGTVRDGGFCRYPYANISSGLPQIQQLSGYSNVEWNPTSRDTFSTTAIVSQKETEWTYAPTPGRDFVIPVGQAGTILNGGPVPNSAPGDDIRTSYRVAELGNRQTRNEDIGFNLNSVYKREFGDTWEWQNVLGYSRTRRFVDSFSGYALLDPLNQGIANGTTNFFNENRSAADFQNAAFDPWQKTSSLNYSFDTSINGELFEIGDNVVSMAIGASYNHMRYKDQVDPFTEAEQVFGSSGTSGQGDRDIFSMYSELNIPFGQFESQIAGRFDSYSDFGSAFSPKFATKWRPNRKFMMRASVGEGFRAPILSDLYRAQTQGFPSFIDAVACKRQQEAGGDTPLCEPTQYQTTSGGNPNLDAEETISYGIGAIFEPVRGFLLGADFWHLDQDNVVGEANINDLTEAELSNPNIASNLGVIINRNEESQEIESIVNPLVNLSQREVTGVDLQMRVTIPTPVGKITINDEHSFMVRYRQSGFPGQALVNRLGLDEEGTPKWRNSLAVVYSPNRSHSFGLTYNSTAGVRRIPLGSGASNGSLRSYGEVDLTYTTRLPWKAQLTAGIKNLKGEIPPFDPRNGFNSSLFQQIGRYGFLNYRQSF